MVKPANNIQKNHSKKDLTCSRILRPIKTEPKDDPPVGDSCNSLQNRKTVSKSPSLEPVIKTESEDEDSAPDLGTGPRYGNFQCLYCPYTTKFKKCLAKHSLKKHGKSSIQIQPSIEYSCPNCSSAHKSKEELRTHIKEEHSDVKPYACSQCYFCSTKIRSLKAHISYMHCDNGFRRKYECNKCFFSSNAKSVLRRHLQSRHSKQYNCSKCNFECNNQSTLTEHESVAHSPPPSPSHTDYIHSSGNGIMTHSSESELASRLYPTVPIKQEVELFSCTDCSFETDSRTVLEEHRDFEHSQGIQIKKVFSIKKDEEYLFLREQE
ncbi:UNVERIFIED_CONTAM: hypothetical protein RMT77_008719 [Armadillidium vulgare]